MPVRAQRHRLVIENAMAAQPLVASSNPASARRIDEIVNPPMYSE